VISGTLNIGGNTSTAGPFASGSNDLISTGVGAFWTPDPDAHGILDAFTIVAVDEDGAESSPPVVATIEVTNQPPQLTSFTGPAASGLEDTEIELDFAAILNVSDASDSDGSVTGFVVNNVPTGTLRIGTDSVSATPWEATTNRTIDANLSAYWTPELNANGVISAIDVVALDDDNAVSSPAVAVKADVAPVADIPLLTQFSGPLSVTNSNTEVEISLTEFLDQGDETDSDGNVGGFRIDSVLSGTLKIGATSAVATAYSAGVNDIVDSVNTAYWTPDIDAKGVLDAFAVVAVDEQSNESVSAVTATIDTLNQSPALTEFTLPVTTTSEDTEVELLMADLMAESDAADSDGIVIEFIVNSVASGSLRIGPDSSSATPFQAGINDTINTSLHAYWTPDANFNGTADAFSVVAVDNDGVESSPAVLSNIDVTPVSDAPEGFDRIIEVAEGTSFVFSDSDFLFSDIENDTFESINIAALPGNGILELNGAPVQSGDDIAIADIAAGNFAYVPATGAASDSFSFSVRDSGTAGSNLDTPKTVTVNVQDGIVDITSGVEINTGESNNAYLISDDSLGVVVETLTFETLFAADVSSDYVAFVSYATTGLSALLDGEIHSLALVFDGRAGAWSVYVDGLLVDQGSGIPKSAVDYSTGKLVLGQEQDRVGGGFNPNQTFAGVYYDVRLWDRALSASEISSSFQHKIDPDHVPDNLLVNWQMDEIDGNDQIQDIVSGNNLTVRYITNDNSFSPGEVRLDLHVDENSPLGTHVGYVRPVDQISNPPTLAATDLNDHGLNRGIHFHRTEGQSIGDWVVSRGSVNIDTGRAFATSPNNNDVIDLNGTSRGEISRDIDTIPGVEYVLNFAYTANGLTANGSISTGLRSFEVFAGDESRQFTYVITDQWSADNLLFEHGEVRFIATSAITQLRFDSLHTGSGLPRGAMVSDIQLQTVPQALPRATSQSINAILNENPDVSYDPVTNKFYEVVDTVATWNTANASAASTLLNDSPGRLIQVESQHENLFVQGLAQEVGRGYWAGGSDRSEADSWSWTNGDVFWLGRSDGFSPR